MLYCDYTNYSNIFEGTYWGNFDLEIADWAFQNIFNNRNKFVVDFNIKKSIKQLPQWVEREINYGVFDHVEVYRDIHDQYVIIFSNYYSKIDEIAYNHKFKKYSPLYRDDATTYIKILPRIKKCHEIIYPDIFNTL